MFTVAILYYDYVLTVPLEVERYWRARMSWAAFLFYVNRYFVVLSHISVIYENFGQGPVTVSAFTN